MVAGRVSDGWKTEAATCLFLIFGQF